MHQTGALDDPLKEMTGLAKTMWQNVTAAAEKYNEPGRFTAFIGYEWTSMPCGVNLGIAMSSFATARTRPTRSFRCLPTTARNPEDLWNWMLAYEQNTGGRLLAIPHNGNLSNGMGCSTT